MQNAAEHKRKRILVCMLACTLAVTGKIIQTKFSVLAFYRRVNKLPKSIQSRLLQYIIKQKYFSNTYMAIYLTIE